MNYLRVWNEILRLSASRTKIIAIMSIHIVKDKTANFAPVKSKSGNNTLKAEELLS